VVTESTIIFDCPVPPWVVGAGAVVLLAAIIYFMRRDAAQLSTVRRRLILALLVPAALMLAGLALAPTLVRSWPDTSKPRCAVLVDGSRSMMIEDAYSGDAAAWMAKHLAASGAAAASATPTSSPTTSGAATAASGTVPAAAGATAVGGSKVKREAVVRMLLAGGAGDWLTPVAKEFDVAGWRFASAAESLAVGPGAAPYEVDAQGYSTALGEALDTATAGTGSEKPRSIVLITDGAWNTGRDPTEVARRLGQQGTPVFVVGLGDTDPPRDAAVVEVRGPKSALLGDELVITARVATTGMGSMRLPVELLGGGKTIETKSVATLPSGQPVSVSFTVVPEFPGRTLYEVHVPVQEGERNEANNSGSLSVEIVERKINVLLVDAEPRWEFRFIRNVLERDPSVKVTVCLLRPGVGPLVGEGYVAALPTDKKDLATYDLVILGDVPRESLPDAFLREMADMIRARAGALILVAGRHENYRRLAGTSLAAVLPVTLDGGTAVDMQVGEPFSPELTPEGATNLVTRLADSAEENEAVWARLPRVRWSAGVSGLAPGHGAGGSSVPDRGHGEDADHCGPPRGRRQGDVLGP
jgi:von Willebrand factor type A domain